jgi:Ca-activated chloride channel family protein
MWRPPRSKHALCLAAAGAALAVCAMAAQQATPQRGATFRTASRTVAIYTTVTAPDGHLATDLHKDDFEVYDDGKRQEMSLFANDVQPITIVSMLDLSGSMSGNIPLLRRAGAQLASHLSKDDRARFGEFGDHVNIVTPAFTNDVNELIRNLWLDLEPGGATPLWNAIDVAMNALADQPGRRVVLVFTDGYDTNSNVVTLAADVKRAQEEDFMIYAVGLCSSDGGLPSLSGSGFGGGGFAGRRPGLGGARGGGGAGSGARGAGFGDRPDPGLKTISEESGGGYLELKAATELDAAFTRVVEELHHQYILGFVPGVLDGRLHKIDVRVKTPGLTARARKSYLAAPETSGGLGLVRK